MSASCGGNTAPNTEPNMILEVIGGPPNNPELNSAPVKMEMGLPGAIAPATQVNVRKGEVYRIVVRALKKSTLTQLELQVHGVGIESSDYVNANGQIALFKSPNGTPSDSIYGAATLKPMPDNKLVTITALAFDANGKLALGTARIFLNTLKQPAFSVEPPSVLTGMGVTASWFAERSASVQLDLPLGDGVWEQVVRGSTGQMEHIPPGSELTTYASIEPGAPWPRVTVKYFLSTQATAGTSFSRSNEVSVDVLASKGKSKVGVAEDLSIMDLSSPESKSVFEVVEDPALSRESLFGGRTRFVTLLKKVKNISNCQIQRIVYRENPHQPFNNFTDNFGRMQPGEEVKPANHNWRIKGRWDILVPRSCPSSKLIELEWEVTPIK